MIGLLIVACAGAAIAVGVVVGLWFELLRTRERLRTHRAYLRAVLASEREVSAAWADVLESTRWADVLERADRRKADQESTR